MRFGAVFGAFAAGDLTDQLDSPLYGAHSAAQRGSDPIALVVALSVLVILWRIANYASK